MKVKSWGTRGSIAISSRGSMEVGGNTTCFEVISDCVPSDTRLMIDAGTGFVPAGKYYLSEIGHGLKYTLLFTHYHHDHIQGLTLAPPTFIERIPMDLYGPVDEGIGPKEMIEHLFKRPFFPVDAKNVINKMKFKTLNDYDVHVIICHPKGGFITLSLDRYKSILSGKRQVIMLNKSYAIEKCLIVKMAKTNHGNSNCISYRFEENPTGKVFVFCTDHEDLVSIPKSLRDHFCDADLAIMDAQYDQVRYLTKTGGFGHGTPRGCIKQTLICGVKRLGLTHHDPSSDDSFIYETINHEVDESFADILKSDLLNTYGVEKVFLTKEKVFICSDYAEFDV